jgi:hypothetical protein
MKKSTIYYMCIFGLASSTGLSMGFSLPMGFEKKIFWERGLP